MIPISSQTPLTFPSHPYEHCHLTLQTVASPPSLSITIECPSDDSDSEGVRYFCGEFSGGYVESITEKAGNRKKFKVFMDMLTKAVHMQQIGSNFTNKEKTANANASYRVSVDLLTASDLVALKSGSSSGSVNGCPSKASGPDDKRYLILTYTTEFDRVHYPLPVCVGGDDVALRRTVARLLAERGARGPSQRLDASYDSGSSSSVASSSVERGGDKHWRKENVNLRKRVSELEKELHYLDVESTAGKKNGATGQSGERNMKEKVAALTSKNAALQAQLKKVTAQHRHKVTVLTQKVDDLKEEVGRGRRAIKSLRGREKELRRELDTRQAKARQSVSRGRSPAHSARSSSAGASNTTRNKSRGNARSVSSGRSNSSEIRGRPAWGAGAGDSSRTNR